jgi:hypothetical protein
MGRIAIGSCASTHDILDTKNGSQSLPLATCLADATYSAFFRFTTDRVIAK